MPSLFIEPGHENEDDTVAMKKLDDDVREGGGRAGRMGAREDEDDTVAMKKLDDDVRGGEGGRSWTMM